MKNQLLAAIALCCATSSTMPLWAQQYGRPDIVTVTPNLTEDETGGGKYYLYHVATGKFLGANDTRLAVDSLGLEVTLTYGEERVPAYGKDPVVPGEGWVFNMLGGKANEGRFHEVYMTSESEAWIDCGTEGHTLYAITKNADNDYYRIKVVAQDPTYGAESGSTMYANGFWGVADMTTYNVNPLTDPNAVGFEDAGVDWQFVTPEEWEVYQAKNGPLRTALNLAAELGYTDVAEYEALFNGTEATAEEITSAASELTVAVNNQAGEGATVDNPKDFTNHIVNPTLDENNDGWTDTETSVGLGRQPITTSYADPDNANQTMAGFMEKWQAAPASIPLHVSQTLTGMPQGRYRLSATTIGYNQANRDDQHRGFYIFADNNRADATTLAFNGIRNGNAEESVNEPCPRDVTLEFFSLGGDITIGALTENTNCNWVAMDNFKLEYLGNEGGIAGELARVAAEAEQTKADLDAAQSAYTAECGTKLTEAIAHAKELAAVSGASDDDLYAALVQVNTRMDSLNLEIEAYEQFSVTLNEIIAIASNSPYQGVSFPKFMAFYTSVQSGYRNKTLTMADMDGAYDEALRLYNEDVQSLLSDGSISNMTGLIQNADFTDNNDSWTFTKNGNGDFKHGNNMAEVWNGRDWEVSQELTGLPEGFYKITAQAFYSPSSPASDVWKSVYGVEGDEVNVVKASIFGNDASALIHHVADFAQETNMGNGCEELANMAVDSLNGKWTPTGLAGAQAIFQADKLNYLNSVTCYVGEEGTLRLGIRLSGVTRDQAWVAFDNFQLTLVKDEAEQQQGAIAALNAKIAEAQALPTADCMVKEAVNGLLEAIAGAQGVVQQASITTEQFVETMASLESAIELFNTANTKFEELNKVVVSYLAEEDNYYALYNGDEVDAFMGLVYDADDLIASGELYPTVAAVDEAMLGLNEAYGKMVISAVDYSGASKDAPVDMTSVIQTPSFSEAAAPAEGEDGETEETEEVASSKGWTATGGTATAAMNYEMFNIGNAELRQMLYGLPKGYYRLAYTGFYRAGNWEPAAKERLAGNETILASVFVEAGDAKWAKPLSSIFDDVHDYLYDGDGVTTPGPMIVLPETLMVDNSLTYNCIPNNVGSVGQAFAAGDYEGDFSFYVSADGQPVAIGLRKDSVIANDWAIIDNFTLEYYGDGDANKPDDFTSSVEDAMAEGTAEVVASQWFTINGVRVDEPKQRGIYIRQDILADGSKKAVKVMVR